MLPYHPALRFKQGEYTAGSKIERDIQAHIQPRFVIPPPLEKDPEKGEPLTADEIAVLTGDRIGKHWPLSPAFLDAHYVASLLGDDGLKRLFQIAQTRNNKLAAVASVDDLYNPVYRRFLRAAAPRLGIYLHYEDVDTRRLIEGVRNVGCTPEECVLFLDFTGAPLELDDVSGSVAALFDELGTAAQWGRLIFQGSAYPRKNPVENNGFAYVPRNEWRVFLEAMKECSISPKLVGYGDFGADCGAIKFPKKSGGIPIRHLRYTSAKSTFVVRGDEAGPQGKALKNICTEIINSEHFSGQEFSYADDHIWRIANGMASGGNATTWRELNTAHHLTRVVRDLGGMSGLRFRDRQASTKPFQYSLLPEPEDTEG